MRKPAEIVFSVEDVTRMDEILQSPPAHLPEKKMRHLKILRALCGGEAGASIASREGVTPQRVSKILGEASRLGMVNVLDRLTLLKKPANEKRPGTRAHAGRPGHERLDQLHASVMAPDAVFELSTLIVSKDVSIATISVAEGRQMRRGGVKADVRPAATAYRRRSVSFSQEVGHSVKTEVFWTRVLMQDSILQVVFNRLRNYSEHLLKTKGKRPPSSVKPLIGRFGKRFIHLVLWSGPKEMARREVNKIVWGLEKDRVIRIPADADLGFVQHLERILHHRRLRKSCTGFLPTAWQLHDKIIKIHESKMAKPFIWKVSEKEVRSSMRDQVLSQYYFAVRGVLPALESSLWEKVPQFEQTRFQKMRIATRISAQETVDPNLFRVSADPLPHLEYVRYVRWNGSKGDLETHLRAIHREEGQMQRFVYTATNPLQIGQASTLLTQRHQIFEDVSNIPERADPGIAVVLLGRHFLTPVSELTSQQLADLARNYYSDAWREQMKDKVVLHALYIPTAIRRRVADHWYLNYMDEIENWQTILQRRVRDEVESIPSDLWMRFRAQAIFGQDIWDELLNLTEAERKAWLESNSNEPSSAEIEHDAEQKIILNVSEMEDGQMPSKGSTVIEYEGESDNGTREEPEEGVVIQWPLERHLEDPFYDDLFESAIKQFDADLLLRSLEPQWSSRLDLQARAWAEECDSIISYEYWPGNRLAMGKVRSLLGGYGMLFNDYKGDMRSACEEVRVTFNKNNTRFVKRRLIETMQRCVLEGHPPVPLVVETNGSILRRWKAFLKETLKGRLKSIVAKRNSLSETPYEDGKKLAAWHEEDEAREIYANSYEVMDASDEGGSDDDVEEILQVLNELLVHGPGDELIARFAALAWEVGLLAWSTSLQEIKESFPKKYRGVVKAIEICRKGRFTGGRLSAEAVKKLRRIFAKT